MSEMTISSIKKSLLPHLRPYKGKEVLAIGTGITGNEFALTRLTALKKEPGWIVQEDSIEEWRIDGFMEQEGEIFLYGPSFKGKTLFEVLENSDESLHDETSEISNPKTFSPKDSILNKIKLLLNAILKLREKNLEIPRIYSDGVLFSDNGSILFLPFNLIKNINATRPIAFKVETYDYINNPSLDGEEAICFTIGVCLYRALTSLFPYEGKTEEEVHDKIRNLKILPPHLRTPGLKKDVSKYVLKLINIENEQSKISLTECYSTINSWDSKTIVEKISEEQKNRIGEEAKRTQEKNYKTFKRKLFWQRNRKTIAIATVIVIIVGTISGSILKNVLAPRKTRGFKPYKVAETFYESMNNLDTQMIQDCVIDKAGKQEVNEVTYLYVISRVSKGYEGKSYLIPAPKWDKMGRPKLNPPDTVYGVLNLNIKEVSGEPNPVFIATYEKWFPISTEEEDFKNPQPTSKPNYAGKKITDKLFLKKDKKDWVIYKIERLSEKSLNN